MYYICSSLVRFSKIICIRRNFHFLIFFLIKTWRSENHSAIQIRRNVVYKIFMSYFQVASVVIEIVNKTASASIQLKFLVHSTATFFPSTRNEGTIDHPIVGLQIGGEWSSFLYTFCRP